ncbi:DegT/DnrJ/EryC1/StrS family aminotransferase [Pontibacillus salicampi]|uniref:DegT/DnrJ/EryC1/StrS family aminotransferase n=1 Tax=Pontibacillus salicampi TaxID=1449801 RepID=A0ABV6LSY4_9BACI
MIKVSQPFLPPKEEYNEYISKLWETKWLTNNGDYVTTLETQLRNYLGVPACLFVSNGTVAMQLAINALGISKKVITTPFSFIATTTSILWQKCDPVFVDIKPETLCIDEKKIEDSITEDTEAILATHVFGIPCNVEAIERIAVKYSLKVIYDAAHAFGVTYNEQSLLQYGDISTISFHSTKLFHTIEGGGVSCNNTSFQKELYALRQFGMIEGEHVMPGINAKNSEFHAAMGLCNLNYVDEVITYRKMLSHAYDSTFNKYESIIRPAIPANVEYNYSYYPIILSDENVLLDVQNHLYRKGIETKRYFYPSLNKIDYLSHKTICPISEDISKRILCLPLHTDINTEDVEFIANIIVEIIHEEIRAVNPIS